MSDERVTDAMMAAGATAFEGHGLRISKLDAEQVYRAMLAARQPSPSAREAVLKCAEICEQVRESYAGTGAWTGAQRCLMGIRVYADTLDNESAAEERKKGHSLEKDADYPGRECKSADPSLTEVSASAADISVVNEFVAQVDGYGNGAPDAPSPAATDPAPEARELTRKGIEHAKRELYYKTSLEQRFLADALCDMALRSLDLQQALARAQERISEMELEHNWSRWLQDCARKTGVTVRYEGDTLCVVHGDFEKDLERAEAELAKVREGCAGGLNDIEEFLRERMTTGAILMANSDDSLQQRGIKRIRAALASAPSAKEGQPGEQSGEGK